MKIPLRGQDSRIPVYTGLSGVLVCALALVTGCGGPAGPPGAKPMAANMPAAGPMSGPPGAPAISPPSAPVNAPQTAAMPPSAPKPAEPPMAKPAEKKPDGPLNIFAPSGKVEQAGATVSLASEIVSAGTNIFLNRLPKPFVAPAPTPGDTTATETAPPVIADPFEGVDLIAIVYNPKMPMAILSVSGGEKQSEVVRKGKVLMVDGGQLRVANIKPDSVELQQLGPGGQKRTLVLPDIVGYGSKSSSDESKATGSETKDEASAPLSNLGKLGTGSGTGANIVLQEP